MNLRFDHNWVVHFPGWVQGSVFGMTLCNLNYVIPGTKSKRGQMFVVETARITNDPVDCMTCLVKAGPK